MWLFFLFVFRSWFNKDIKIKNNTLRVEFYKNGELHRDNKPAVYSFYDYPNDIKLVARYYYQNGKLHRSGGMPASYQRDGIKFYENGLLHRKDGPAAIYFPEIPYTRISSLNTYYYKGEKVEASNDKEFEKLVRLQLFW